VVPGTEDPGSAVVPPTCPDDRHDRPRAAAKIGFRLLVKSGVRWRRARAMRTVPTPPDSRRLSAAPPLGRCGCGIQKKEKRVIARSILLERRPGGGRGIHPRCSCSAISNTAPGCAVLSSRRVFEFRAAIRRLVEETPSLLRSRGPSVPRRMDRRPARRRPPSRSLQQNTPSPGRS